MQDVGETPAELADLMACLRVTEDAPQLAQPAPEEAAVLPEATVVRPPLRDRAINELLVCDNAWDMSRCIKRRYLLLPVARWLSGNNLQMTLHAKTDVCLGQGEGVAQGGAQTAAKLPSGEVAGQLAAGLAPADPAVC